MKTLLNREAKYLVKDPAKDYHTEFGAIKATDFSLDKAKTNTGKEFSIFDSQFIDLYEKLKRKAQIITLKDIGVIIANTGLNKESVVIDAGSGSGALCCFLAHLCKCVTSYDIREDHQVVAKENADIMGLKNITFKIGDVREGIDVDSADVIILDMPDPWSAFTSAAKSLKRGGFLVLYSPTVPQVMDSVNLINEKHSADFLPIKTLETIEREWEVDGRKVRPASSYINHTGFLTFLRRI